MKRNNKFFSMLYVVLCLAFFYLSNLGDDDLSLIHPSH